MQNNVLDYLSQIVTKVPDKMAFSDGTDSLTFLELYDQSRSIGTFLHNNKVYKEPVVIFMDKHPNTIAAFLGVIAGDNTIFVAVDGLDHVDTIRRRLEDLLEANRLFN